MECFPRLTLPQAPLRSVRPMTQRDCEPVAEGGAILVARFCETLLTRGSMLKPLCGLTSSFKGLSAPPLPHVEVFDVGVRSVSKVKCEFLSGLPCK